MFLGKNVKLNGSINRIKFVKDDYSNKWIVKKINGWMSDNIQYIDGSYYSQDSIESMMDEGSLYICEDCGDYVWEGDIIYIEEDQKFICQHCADYNYYYCDDCGSYHSNTTRIQDLCIDVCDSCLDNYYYCDGCGDWYSENAIHYNDNDGCYYCDDCYEEEHGLIYGYHDFDDWCLYKEADEVDPDYIGGELEVAPGDGCYDEDEAAQAVYDNINAVCMHDGSLDDGGFEIVTHPQSFKYIMNHAGNYERLFEILKNNGYRSHDPGCCGLHFHVTAPGDPDVRAEVIDRLWAVLEFYKNEIKQLSRRRDDDLHWCKWLSDKTCDNMNYFTIKDNYEKNSERYLAINNTNKRAKTIEFRFFRGTLNFNTFMGAVEFINNLYKLCKDLSIDLKDITWDRLTTGYYISNYCNEKGIHNNTFINYDIKSYYHNVYMIEYNYNKIIKIFNNKITDLFKEYMQAAKNKNDAYTIDVTCQKIASLQNIKAQLYEAQRLYNNKNYYDSRYQLKEIYYNFIEYHLCNKGRQDVEAALSELYNYIEKNKEVLLCA